MARTKDETLTAARKGEILTAAALCFVQHGIHQASMRQVCKQAKLSAGAVYNYFDSKEAIIEAIAERDRKEISELSEYLANSKNSFNAIIQATKWIIEETSKENAQLQIELLSEASRNKTVRKHMEANDVALSESIRDTIISGQQNGTIDKTVKESELTQIIVATYEGFLGRIAADDKSDRKALSKLAEHMLIKILKP